VPATIQAGVVGSSALSMITAVIATTLCLACAEVLAVLLRATPGYRLCATLLLICRGIVTIVCLFAAIACGDALHRLNAERGAFRGEWRGLKV